jgi:predicted RND superfamily exporter protein
LRKETEKEILELSKKSTLSNDDQKKLLDLQITLKNEEREAVLISIKNKKIEKNEGVEKIKKLREEVKQLEEKKSKLA